MNRITLEGRECDMPGTFTELSDMCRDMKPLRVFGREYFVVSITVDRCPMLAFYAARRIMLVLQEVAFVAPQSGSVAHIKHVARMASVYALDVDYDNAAHVLTIRCHADDIEKVRKAVEPELPMGTRVTYEVRK